MLIVGELINSTRKRVAEAVAARDTAYIADLARKQKEAGVDLIDVNAGARPQQEPEDLAWLVRTVQAAVDGPLCLDSPSPQALEAALAVHRGRALVNSITEERERYEAILPLVRRHQARVVGLTIDDAGMPSDVERRVEIARHLAELVEGAGVARDDLFIDPLIRPVSTEADQGRAALEGMREIRRALPGVHIICGLSNISFGLPHRKLINRTFLAMALAMGLDAALVDPLDRNLMAVLRAGEAVLGKDEYCVEYLAAYRAGVLEG